MNTPFEELESPYLDGELEFAVPVDELSHGLQGLIGESPFAKYSDGEAPTVPEASLYERLGGVFAIAAVIDRFSDALVQNPIVGRQSKNPALREWHTNNLGRLPGLKFMRTLWVCAATGGPFDFFATRPGRTALGLEEAHRRLRISPEQFDAAAGELARTLDAFDVPEREKQEVLGAFAAHKDEVTDGYRAIATDRAFAPTDEAESFAGEVQFEELEPLQDEQTRNLESDAVPELGDEADGERDSDNSLFGHFLLESAVADRLADEAASDFELGEELAFSGEDDGRHQLEGGEPAGEWEGAAPAGEWESAELVGEWEGAPFEPGLEQFDGSEHKWIGDKGSGGVKTALVYGAANTPLTFGDVVALAGDMYASYYDLAEKSRKPGGRAELAWALWLALKVPKAPEPRAYVAAKGEDVVETKKREDAVKKDVGDRYLALAAENISHFSAGGTGAATYMKWHLAAMANALAAGQNGDDHQWRIAIGKEAFGDHFLTDIFSAGHVRTPRAEIKEWYRQHGLGSSAPFVNYMAEFMLSRLRGRNPWLNIPIVSGLALGVLQTRVRDLGGEALQSVSLGDIVSLALHDLDNEGLDVVSKVDSTGLRFANGKHWRAIGDSHLPAPQRGEARAIADTRAMVTAAVVVSLRDLARVREAGRRIGKRNLSAPASAQAIKDALKGTLFPALDYVPKEDMSSKSNPTLTSTSGRADLEWRWGQLGPKAYDSVNKAVKGQIQANLEAKIEEVDDPATASLGIKIHGTKPALRAFVSHLQKEGIKALERAVDKPARVEPRSRTLSATSAR